MEWDVATSMYALYSVNDASILCENFVKFGLVTPELTELICERQIRRGQKNWRI